VVFFGDRLTNFDLKTAFDDLKLCDLVMVMGASLSMYPANRIPGFRNITTPCLLINNEWIDVPSKTGSLLLIRLLPFLLVWFVS